MSCDCLILGFYDYSFSDYAATLKAMGTDSGAWRDLALAFVEYEGKPLRALELLTRFHYEGRPKPERPFHNADFLWPVAAYLTSYLRRRGYEADYVNLPHFERDMLREKLEAGAKSVAITTTLYVSPDPILDLVEMVREYDESVRVIVGGPYIANNARTMDHAALSELFDYLGADIYVLCNEGEATLSSLLQAFKEGGALDSVPNLAFRNARGTFTFTGVVSESNVMSENVIDYAAFRREDVGEFLSLRTAKSCPFHCAFCGFPERAGEYRYLSVDEVEKQLDMIAGLGSVTTITFLDDTFNVPKGRFKDLLKMMIRNNYGFRWNSFYRCDQGDAETIELMARAGCEGVFLGVESGSDRMLCNMQKTSRRIHYTTAIPLLKDAGISAHVSLIIGFPGETDDTVRETIDFLEETRPEYYRAQLWYADPVTPIWKQRKQYGVQGLAFNWSHNTMDYRQACDWIEKMFLEITASTWLPQFGFEQWSTFYLSRKGMAREQIHEFICCFNECIRHRMKTGKPEMPKEMEREFGRICQFDKVTAEAGVG